MSVKYQLLVNGLPQAPIFHSLDDAKTAGRILAASGDLVHIEIFPQATLPPTPMSALRFDAEVRDWVATDLPIQIS